MKNMILMTIMTMKMAINMMMKMKTKKANGEEVVGAMNPSRLNMTMMMMTMISMTTCPLQAVLLERQQEADVNDNI